MLLEPAVLSRLEHPNIVKLEDYFLKGDDLVLALEFIDGSDLKTLLEEGEHFSQADVREMLIQLGGALAAAHEQNILHRDIKPANVLVQRTSDGWRFVLTDFGIGQVREGIQQRRQTGGTYLFMAPEQLRGRPAPQSDLWALGVIAYRMLTGRMPFPGPTFQELTNQILYGGVTPPSELAKEPIDPDLERAILRLLDKSLQERTSSAAELLRDLGHSPAAPATVRTAAKPAAVTLD
jgi:serine/threonine-protein kinase